MQQYLNQGFLSWNLFNINKSLNIIYQKPPTPKISTIDRQWTKQGKFSFEIRTFIYYFNKSQFNVKKSWLQMSPCRSCRRGADPKWLSSWTSGTSRGSGPKDSSAPDNWNGDRERSAVWRRPFELTGEVRRWRNNRCRIRSSLRRRERAAEEVLRHRFRRRLPFPGIRILSVFSFWASSHAKILRLVCGIVRGGRSVVRAMKVWIWGRSRSRDSRRFWENKSLVINY